MSLDCPTKVPSHNINADKDISIPILRKCKIQYPQRNCTADSRSSNKKILPDSRAEQLSSVSLPDPASL